MFNITMLLYSVMYNRGEYYTTPYCTVILYWTNPIRVFNTIRKGTICFHVVHNTCKINDLLKE